MPYGPPSGGGGATIPNTTNVLKGDDAGNAADSGVPLNGTHIAGLTVDAGPGGVLNMDCGPGGSSSGGNINMSGGAVGAGGNINMSGGEFDSAGNLNTSSGGGDIDTTGTGSVQFGEDGTRTTVTGTATANRAIALPDADGTLFLNGGALADGTTATTQSPNDNSNKAASTEYVDTAIVNGTGLEQILIGAGITPAADGTYPLPTSITIQSGIITAIS